MTVQELIDKLKNMPSDNEVIIEVLTNGPNHDNCVNAVADEIYETPDDKTVIQGVE